MTTDKIATHSEILDRLKYENEYIHGGYPEHCAESWAGSDLTMDQIQSYWDAGVFEPVTAHLLSDAGIAGSDERLQQTDDGGETLAYPSSRRPRASF